ncbi:hypothetical protein B0T17DRAFT_610203 [Bombardia bombarda]|uniref:FAD-binding domain-containing protein n=1 Tax=Bombardia bombarda TaxID=252184 RepID=A0AA39WH08_9PEZI|nr:hypothetical protein B0T17DRAFT_610203 [Bombardia bombarda]
MSNFKVIIVGGGPVGLIAGHCLASAGIDFEILERRPTLDHNWGASTVVWAHNARVLDQLGLLDHAMKIYSPIRYKRNIRADGSLIGWNNVYQVAEKFHAYPWLFFPRNDMINMFHNHLPGKETRVHANKKATGIETTDKGVTVHCADGTSFTGSIVIGADGVNSTVRALMSKPLSSTPDASASTTITTTDKAPTPTTTDPEEPNTPMKTSYIALFARCTGMPDVLEPYTMCETHSPRLAAQAIHNQTNFFFLLYITLDVPTTDRKRFTDADADAYVARPEVADFHITPTLTVSQAWPKKFWHHMTYSEEGLAPRWSDPVSGRVVLAGDSAHKMLPTVALGFNSGLQSMVAITNGLAALLKTTKEPSGKQLKEVWEGYERVRRESARKTMEVTSDTTRLISWRTRGWRFVDQYVLPKIGGEKLLLRLRVSPLVREGLVLEGIEEKGYKEGTIKWKNGRGRGGWWRGRRR